MGYCECKIVTEVALGLRKGYYGLTFRVTMGALLGLLYCSDPFCTCHDSDGASGLASCMTCPTTLDASSLVTHAANSV